MKNWDAEEKNVGIEAELKNITSRIWYVGYKLGKYWEVNASGRVFTWDNRLYMVICMRLYEMFVKYKTVTENKQELSGTD